MISYFKVLIERGKVEGCQPRFIGAVNVECGWQGYKHPHHLHAKNSFCFKNSKPNCTPHRDRGCLSALPYFYFAHARSKGLRPSELMKKFRSTGVSSSFNGVKMIFSWSIICALMVFTNSSYRAVTLYEACLLRGQLYLSRRWVLWRGLWWIFGTSHGISLFACKCWTRIGTYLNGLVMWTFSIK